MAMDGEWMTSRWLRHIMNRFKIEWWMPATMIAMLLEIWGTIIISDGESTSSLALWKIPQAPVRWHVVLEEPGRNQNSKHELLTYRMIHRYRKTSGNIGELEKSSIQLILGDILSSIWRPSNNILCSTGELERSRKWTKMEEPSMTMATSRLG